MATINNLYNPPGKGGTHRRTLLNRRYVSLARLVTATTIASALALTHFSPSSEAATFSANASCPGGPSDAGPFFAECNFFLGTQSASARAQAGGGRLGAEAVASTSSGGVASTATAGFSDVLGFPVESGVFRLSFAVTGSAELDVSAFGGRTNGTIGFARADWSLGVVGGPRLSDQVIGSAVSLNDDVILSQTGQTGESSVDLPISSSTLPLFGGITATANCSLGGCTASALFGSTLTLMGGEVFDVNGEPVPNAIVTSESGFDYLSPAPIPLPPALILLLSTLGLLGLFGHRTRRCK